MIDTVKPGLLKVKLRRFIYWCGNGHQPVSWFKHLPKRKPEIYPASILLRIRSDDGVNKS